MLLARHFSVVTVIATAVVLGCKSSNSSTTSASDSASRQFVVARNGKATGAATQPVVEAAPAPGTAEALAQRATTYAQSVGPLLSQHEPVKRPAASQDADLMPTSAKQLQAPAQDVPKPVAPKPNTPLDNRAFAAAASKPDVQVVRQSPGVVQPPAPALPATDAQTAAFARRASEYPQDLSAQTDNQLLKLLKEESVPDLQSMSGLAPEDRELLSALMDALTNFRNQLRQNNNMVFSKKIAPLVDLGDRLKSQAELTVPTLVLVSHCTGFGRYDAMDPPRFVAGKSQMVGVYYEVENFSSQLNDNKMYETKLVENVVIYTESSGLPVWTDRKTTLVDAIHHRRRDFFNAKYINLPPTLTIGRYLLKVTVEDQQAHRIAENTVPLELVAQ